VIWSVSTAKIFEQCQRKWFFKTQFSNSNPKTRDLERRRAYLLGKLQSISAWRGNVVDQILSKQVLPAFERGWSISEHKAIAAAMSLFDKQLEIGRLHRLHEAGFNPSDDADFVAFYDLEYKGLLAEQEVERARDEVKRALSAFFSMDDLIERLRTANRLITQRSLSFAHADASVRAVPDVLVFKGSSAPTIIDWKVHVFGWRDAWLQLAVYATALAHCEPHKDFPVPTNQFRETDIELLEVQLLRGTIRTHNLAEEHFHRADAFIARTAESMTLALDGMNGKAWSLPRTDFPVTRYAGACQSCPYRSICWEITS